MPWNKIIKGHKDVTFLSWRNWSASWKLNQKWVFHIWAVDFSGTQCEETLNFCSLFDTAFVAILFVLVYWRVKLIYSSHVCNNRTLCTGGGPTDITLNPVTKLGSNLQYKLDKCCNNVMASSEMETLVKCRQAAGLFPFFGSKCIRMCLIICLCSLLWNSLGWSVQWQFTSYKDSFLATGPPQESNLCFVDVPLSGEITSKRRGAGLLPHCSSLLKMTSKEFLQPDSYFCFRVHWENKVLCDFFSSFLHLYIPLSALFLTVVLESIWNIAMDV